MQSRYLDTSSKFIIVVALLMVLGNYYFLYFVDFNQGVVSNSSPYWHLVKVIATTLLLFSLLRPKLKKAINPIDFLLLLVLFLFFIIFLFKSSLLNLHVNNYMFINTLMLLVPFLIFYTNKNFGRIVFLFDTALKILVIQILLDVVIYLYGYSLWNNKAFIGGLGNPSSFGMACNIFLLYNLILNVKMRKTSRTVVTLILLCGVFMSSALLPLLISVFIISFWGILTKSYSLLILTMLLAVFHRYILSDHLIYKIQSLVNGDMVDVSASISTRSDAYNLFIERITESSIELTLFGYSDFIYYVADSQFLVYVGSFGVIAALLFFIVVAIYIGLSLTARNPVANFSAAGLSILFITFFVNRILDYYPLTLFFVLFIILSQRSKYIYENWIR